MAWPEADERLPAVREQVTGTKQALGKTKRSAGVVAPARSDCAHHRKRRLLRQRLASAIDAAEDRVAFHLLAPAERGDALSLGRCLPLEEFCNGFAAMIRSSSLAFGFRPLAASLLASFCACLA